MNEMKLLFDSRTLDKRRWECFQAAGQRAQMLCITGRWKSRFPGRDGPVLPSFYSVQQKTAFPFVYCPQMFKSHNNLITDPMGLNIFSFIVFLQTLHVAHVIMSNMCDGQNTPRSASSSWREMKFVGKWPKSEPFSPLPF